MEHRAGITADDDEILDAVQRFAQFAFDQVVEKDFAPDKSEAGSPGDLFRLDRGGDPGERIRIQAEQHRSVRSQDLQLLESGQSGGIFHGFPFVVYGGPGQTGSGKCDLSPRGDFNFSMWTIQWALSRQGRKSDDPAHGSRIRQPEQYRRCVFGWIHFVGMAGFDQFLRRLPVGIALRRLIHRLAVVIQPQPVHAVEQRIDRLFGRTLQVGIFDPQQEFPAAVTRIQPVENGGPDIADMNLSRRGRCKSRSETHGQNSFDIL